MRYGESTLDEVLRRTDLVRLVGRRVKLQRRGRLFWGLCPFHREKSPSFKVESERRNYKCFGCGASGDAFKWLMETEGLKFPEAVERLAQEAGVSLPKPSAQDEAREMRRKTLYEIVETGAAFFERQLIEPQGSVAREYLARRGLDESSWKRFRLGYAPQARSALLEHLKAKGVSGADVVAAGLAREGGPDAARDFFFHRVMFPIADAKGRIVAFGARALESEAKPKYINTGETAIFSKGQLLYNFQTARAAAFQSGQMLVAEGYMDVIALVRAGFEGAVAPLGTALTADQLGLSWRTVPEPVLSFDGDEAGQRAAARAALMALPLLSPGHSLRFAFLPAGEDPDSLIRAAGPDAMRNVLDAAIPLVDMVWRVTVEGGAFDTPERKAALVSRLNETLGEIASTDVRRFYLEAMSARLLEGLGAKAFVYGDQLRVSAGPRKRTGMSSPPPRQTGVVSTALKTSSLARAKQKGGAPFPSQPGAEARRLKESEVLALLLDAPEILERRYEALAALPLSDRTLDSLRHELLNLAASGFRLETPRLEDHLVRAGMAGLLGRLKARRAAVPADSSRGWNAEGGGAVDVDATETRWLEAAAQLRDMAELEAERKKALERFVSEANEESWRDWHRLLLSRAAPGG
jgi:DNA primase